jgi:hypothetical protein
MLSPFDDYILPRRARGRPRAAGDIEYREKVGRFCALILQIRSTMDFTVGSRGWCYILERHGLRKGDFDIAQRLITVRKCEANALVVEPDLGRQLCRDAILRFIPADAAARYSRRLKRARLRLRRELRSLVS